MAIPRTYHNERSAERPPSCSATTAGPTVHRDRPTSRRGDPRHPDEPDLLSPSDGNTFIERLSRNLKGDVVWPNELTNHEEAEAAITARIADYNAERPYQARGDRTPAEVQAAGSTQSAA